MLRLLETDSAAGGVYYDSGDYEYAEEVSEENGSSQAETVEKGETTGRKLIRNVDMDVETESFRRAPLRLHSLRRRSFWRLHRKQQHFQ